jgi:hypothetical protein
MAVGCHRSIMTVESNPYCTEYQLLFDISTQSDITVDGVLEYNKFYLFFTKLVNDILRFN